MSIVNNLEGNKENKTQYHTIRQTMSGENGIYEGYHLNGCASFGMWAYRMKNLFEKDGWFHYCLTPPSKPLNKEEQIAQPPVMSIINSNVKNNALKLLRRYSGPHECMSELKIRYKFDSIPCRIMLRQKIL